MARAGPWLVAVVVAGAVLFAFFTGGGAPDPVARGSRAPGFDLPSIDGESVALGDLRGQVVLLNFWATWCKPCEEEMPAMERLYQALRQDGFTLLAISVDERIELVREFQERLSLSFPMLHDPTQQVSQRYQTYRFPESLLVDRDGVVVERYVGAKPWDSDAYVARIRRLLEAG